MKEGKNKGGEGRREGGKRRERGKEGGTQEMKERQKKKILLNQNFIPWRKPLITLWRYLSINSSKCF